MERPVGTFRYVFTGLLSDFVAGSEIAMGFAKITDRCVYANSVESSYIRWKWRFFNVRGATNYRSEPRCYGYGWASAWGLARCRC